MRSIGIVTAGLISLPYMFSSIELYHSGNSNMVKYIETCPIIKSKFVSNPLMNSGLLQSYWGAGLHQLKSDLTEVKSVEYTRQYYKFDDGGTYSLDWMFNNSNKILFIVPGLTGGSKSIYIKHICKEAYKRGYNVIVANGRGLEGTPLTVKFK
jgi:predicted alpha/beta-fold hydrolase